LLVLERPGSGDLVTWTPVMERHSAEGCCRDWSHAEWYDGSPVGWDPCDVPGCSIADHVLRVKRALIVPQA
jgi:hypothetical protein